MTRKEIEKLNGQVIAFAELEEIELHEEVANVENCGNSGRFYNCTWYSVEFQDGEEIDVYTVAE